MRRYLVVAHRTLGGQHLLDEVRARLEAGPCQFYLLVPVHHPAGQNWTEGQLEAAARQSLEDGLARFRELGADVDGEVGDANPVYAIETVTRDRAFDEIILSTLPAGPSRWLKLDVPTRVARQFRMPVTHLVAEPESVS
jgi:hypothetical protein